MRTTLHWEEAFDLLRAYAERVGHARVPTGHLEAGFKLGKWVNVQRVNRQQMSPGRRERLGQLPGWTWDAREAHWEDAFDWLGTYAKRVGHARVARDHLEGSFKLGQWVKVQRRRREQMSPGRRERLARLPGWTWDVFDARWEDAFDLLRTYAKRMGHARVPQNHVEAGFKLGRWVSMQRSGREQLASRRRKRLEQFPGWTWDVFDARWEDAFDLLRAYTKRTGHARVPQNHVEAGFKLGVWVNDRRMDRQRMGTSRRARLEAVPGWAWTVRDASPKEKSDEHSYRNVRANW